MLVWIAVATVATALLVGLAVRVGTADAAEKAWKRIAAERRTLAERSRALEEREVALSYDRERLELMRQHQILRAARTEDCPQCGHQRDRGERSAS